MADNTERLQAGGALWQRWVLASSVGLGVGLAVTLVMAFFTFFGEADCDVVCLSLVGVVLGAVLGASVGIPQSFVLWRQVSRSGWWILASIVGMAMGLVVGGGVGGGVGVVVGIVLYGAITGSVLVWLLRQPVTEEPSLPQDAAEPEGERQSIAEEPSYSQDAAETERGGIKRWFWAIIGVEALTFILVLIWLANQDAVTALFEAQPAKEARVEAPLNDPSPPSGTLDLANCEQLAGWAWDPKTPSQPIEVQIYDHFEDGTEELVVRIVANLSRPDVVRVTGDNGMHGFVVSTPAALRDGLSHTIRAYAVNSDARLPNRILNGSDVQIRCP